jgi:valyl-tRNA synthetase
MVDEEAEKNGDMTIAVMSAFRNFKAENKQALNAPYSCLTINTGSAEHASVLNESFEDIRGTLKVDKLIITADKKSAGRQISPYDIYFEAKQ